MKGDSVISNVANSANAAGGGLQRQDLGVLRFLTCGSVDDGKSTLIGRLLYDTKTLLTDTLATMARHAEKRGLSALDLSLLTDGLTAEREQGITIDVAYRYFATARRKFIIADAPGHEQYTRNMVTAASTADVAVLLIDARKGILPQTRRHATLAALLGIRQVILAVNKMDLVGFAQPVYERICADFAAWLAQRQDQGSEQGPEQRLQVHTIALSALDGDMVVDRGERLSWYRGPTFVELLEHAPAAALNSQSAARFAVQWVCRPAQVDGAEAGHHDAQDFRGYAGRLSSGTLTVGDEVQVLPSGARSRISRIGLGETELQHAHAGQSIMVSLTDERDISRGDMLVRAAEPAPRLTQQLTATVCWLSAEPLSLARSYVLQHGTRSVKAKVVAVQGHLDLHTLTWQTHAASADNAAASDAVTLNALVRLSVKTQQPLVADTYATQRETGSFILIDEATNNTVAAGMIE